MSGLFDKIVSGKEIVVKDVCDVEPFIDGLIQNVFQSHSVLSIKRVFPFTSSFKDLYIKTIEERFEKDKESMVETVLRGVKDKDQIFETKVVLGDNLGYIRYLFPIPYAEALIRQGGFNPVQLDVSSLYEFSKHIEVDENYHINNTSPIIVLRYPQSSPDFFVLDGNHRVVKAYKKNQKTMEAYLLPEGAMNLLAPQRLFALLSKIHLNLTLIGLYMVGDIILSQLKEWYQPITNEEWSS